MDFVHTHVSQSVCFLSNFSIFFFSTDLQTDAWQTVSCPIILFDARSRGQGRVTVAARAHMHANTCTRNFILGWLPLIAADFPNSAVSLSLSLNICVWSESCINYSPAAAPCLRLSLLLCFLLRPLTLSDRKRRRVSVRLWCEVVADTRVCSLT